MAAPWLWLALGTAGGLFALSRSTKGRSVIDAGIDRAVTRGIRNNNPGNIRRTRDVWNGQSLVQNDPEFVVFDAPQFGVRALGRVLLSYEKRGLRTVAGLIGQWAPASENDTESYVENVSRSLAVDPDQTIDVHEYLPRLAAAIIQHENGVQPYAQSDLKKWVLS